MGLTKEGIWLHVSSFDGDGVIGAVASFAVNDIDILFEELKANNVEIKLEPFDQTWGSRENVFR